MTYFYILYLQVKGGGERPSLFQHVSQPVETNPCFPHTLFSVTAMHTPKEADCRVCTIA